MEYFSAIDPLLRKAKLIALALLLPVVLLLSLAGYAQQPSHLSQYMFNEMVYNPAFAGNGGGICANGLFRQQYIGFKDDQGNKLAPQSFFLTLDAPIRKIHGGIGGSVTSDKIGFFNNISVNLGYAFRMDLGAGTFAIGAQFQLDNIKLDYDKLKENAFDPEQDPVLQGIDGNQTDLLLDGNLGLYYEVPDKFYVGIASQQIAQSFGRNTHYQHRRTYTLNGGYNYVLPSYPLWEIKPAAMIYYDGGAFQWNLSALVTYKKKYWGGLGYRFQDAAIILAGLNIKNFRVGLSYDISTSALTSYSSGSLEVMLGYCFKMELEKYRKRYKNTRFL